MGSESGAEGTIEALLADGRFDEAAVATITLLGPPLLGYLAALLRDVEQAREAFAMFSEDLWRGLPTYRAESTFRAWAYRVARNAALRSLRDPYLRRGRRLATDEHSALMAAVRSTTAAHERPSADAKLARLRDALTPEEHALLILRVDRDLAWSEIATALASDDDAPDEGTLRKRFERLKLKLRRLASDAGMLDP